LIFSFGPSFQWQSSQYLSEANILFAPTQKVDADNELKSSLGLQVSTHRPLGKNILIGIVGGYSQNQVEDTNIQKVSVGVSVRWSF
jgi:hypothetical protein